LAAVALRGRSAPLADLVGLGLLVALDRLRQIRPADPGDRLARVVVDELREDAAVRAEDDEPRPLRAAAHLAAHSPMSTKPSLADGQRAHALLPTLRRTNSPS